MKLSLALFALVVASSAMLHQMRNASTLREIALWTFLVTTPALALSVLCSVSKSVLKTILQIIRTKN